MKQLSFSDAEYGGKRKRTRREVFLAEMHRAVPWGQLEALIAPHYPKAGGGRRPYPLATMLRIHCLQQWYGLSDPAMEEELYEIASMRQFAGLSLARGSVPDETTILNFRHLLERHGLAREIFETVKGHLQAAGLLLRRGTIVDATIIAAPSSTKNSTGERDPEMHQTRKACSPRARTCALRRSIFSRSRPTVVARSARRLPGLIATCHSTRLSRSGRWSTPR